MLLKAYGHLAQYCTGYKVGWRAFTDLDKAPEDEDAKDRRLYNSWISEQYYGQWYHNAAVIVVVRVIIFPVWHLTKPGAPVRLHDPLPHALRLWLGMALHPSRFL